MRFIYEIDWPGILHLMEQMPHAMLFVDDQGMIVKANDLFMQATQCDESHIKGAPFDQFVAFHRKIVSVDALGDSPMQYFECEVIAQGGRRLPTGAQSQRWSEGKRAFFLMSFFHITKAPDSYIQLFAKHLITDINMGVLIIDREERLVEINELACRLLGVKRETVLTKSLVEAFPGIPNEHQLLQGALLDGVTVRDRATSWTNGNQRYELLLDSDLIRDEAGQVVAAYIAFKDVTNLRSLDEQVQRNERLAMIGQIAAGTAHEIRNPLTSIKGFLQVLRYGLTEKGLVKEQEYTDIMLKEIDRINELVSEFLLLSKPRNAKYELINIQDVLAELLPIVQNEALLHNVEVQYEPYADLPPVIADSELLKQVYLNICKNGIEVMSDGGVLKIREKLSSKENKAVVEIHDTGPGIPHYVVDKIFDPFFTTKENGTGLGLPVCQRIIHDIGGNIRASTKGFGTVFSISIPYRSRSKMSADPDSD